MRKVNMKKAFTLVEMLIVVIIIGILMSALLPKLTGAQGGARDAARSLGVNNISTALFQYQSNKGIYPEGSCTTDLRSQLSKYLTTMPTDPQSSKKTYGTKAGGCTSGSFAYAPLYSMQTEQGGFVLVANTESEGKKSNFILPHDNVFFTGSVSDKVANINGADVDNINSLETNNTKDDFKLSNNTNSKVYDSKAIPLLICKDEASISSDGAGTMCKQDLINEGISKKADTMTYVVFK